MTTVDKPDQTENDRAIGYFYGLDSGNYSAGWLAREIRMLHVQVDSANRERREHERRLAAREANQRHVIAHEIAARMFAWKLGKYAQQGADKVLEALYPISRCEPYCDGGAR